MVTRDVMVNYVRFSERAAAGCERRMVCVAGGLFDGDALGEVAGLVHVAPFSHRDVVGQELEGDHEK